MIVVKVELHSARTGEVTEIGRMHISNVGGTMKRRNYAVEVMRRGTHHRVQRRGEVHDHASESYPIWELVRKAIASAFRR